MPDSVASEGSVFRSAPPVSLVLVSHRQRAQRALKKTLALLVDVRTIPSTTRCGVWSMIIDEAPRQVVTRDESKKAWMDGCAALLPAQRIQSKYSTGIGLGLGPGGSETCVIDLTNIWRRTGTIAQEISQVWYEAH